MSLMANLFGRSPVRPMQQHMSVAVDCARAVLPLVEDMVAGRVENLPSRREEIDRLEHEADDIKHEIRSRLPRRLLLAMERRDLLEILDFQDSIADVAQDIAGLADQRSMTVPEGLGEPFLDLDLLARDRAIDINTIVTLDDLAPAEPLHRPCRRP